MRISVPARLGVPRIRVLWVVVEAYKKFRGDDSMPMAAAISYSALFSIFPLLLGVIALLSLVVDEAAVREAVRRALTEYLPAATARFVDRNIAQTIRARGAFGALAIVSLFWSATAVASTIRHALNRVWGVEQYRPPYVFRKAIELTLILFGGGLLVLSLITSVVTIRLLSAFPAMGPYLVLLKSSTLARFISTFAPLVFAGFTFFVIYRFLPNLIVPWRSSAVGAIVSAILFEGANRAFFWYLKTFARYELVYGSLAGIIVFLVWIYVSAAILLFGAEIAFQVGRPLPGEMPAD